jgi:hypothetical protein
MIHEHVRLIRELVVLARYVRPPTGERRYDDPVAAVRLTLLGLERTADCVDSLSHG